MAWPRLSGMTAPCPGTESRVIGSAFGAAATSSKVEPVGTLSMFLG